MNYDSVMTAIVLALFLGVAIAPSLIGLYLGSRLAVFSFKAILRRRRPIVWIGALTLSLIWLILAVRYWAWLYKAFVQASWSMPAAGPNYVGLLYCAFIYGPLGAFLLAPSVAALLTTLRLTPRTVSRRDFVWIEILVDQLRGPARLYWWGILLVSLAITVNVSVWLLINFLGG